MAITHSRFLVTENISNFHLPHPSLSLSTVPIETFESSNERISKKVARFGSFLKENFVKESVKSDFSSLEKVMILLAEGENEMAQKACVKSSGYARRFFGTESWKKWVEHRTSLGRVFSSFSSYAEMGERVAQRLDIDTIQEANLEAASLLLRLNEANTPTENSLVIDTFSSFDKKLTSLITLFPIVSAQPEIGTKIIKPDFIEKEKISSTDFKDDHVVLCNETLLDVTFSKNHLKDLIEKLAQNIEEQKQNAQGKDPIFFFGPTGSGKGTLINYLFSKVCTSNVIKIQCDENPVQASNKRGSNTSTIQVLDLNDRLKEKIGANTVFIDTPGFYDNRINCLNSLIYSAFASKGIYEIKANLSKHVNAFLIDIDTFNTMKGTILGEVKKLIDQLPSKNTVIIVTKAKTKIELETSNLPANVLSTKHAIAEALKQEGIQPKEVLLYNVMDEEMASDHEIRADNIILYHSNGGTNRDGMLKLFKQILETADESSLETKNSGTFDQSEHLKSSIFYMVDPHFESKLTDVKNQLELAFTNGCQSNNFTMFNEMSGNFNLMKGINHPSFSHIGNQTHHLVNDKIGNEIREIFHYISLSLDRGEIPAIEAIKERKKGIRKFRHVSPVFITKESIQEKVKSIWPGIQKRALDIISTILKQPSSWNEQQAKKLRSIINFEREIALQAKSTREENPVNKIFKENIGLIEENYYVSLHLCEFETAESSASEFNKLTNFLEQINYTYGRKLASFRLLKDAYKNRVWLDSTMKSVSMLAAIAGIGLGGVAAAGIYSAVKSAIAVKGFAALTALGKAAVVKNAVLATSTIIKAQAAFSATGATIAILASLRSETCQGAWNNFPQDKIPQEYKI